MIRCAYFPSEKNPLYLDTPDEIKNALQDETGFVWVSLERPDGSEVSMILQDVFHFHPLTIEDCLSPGYQSPKVDDFRDYLFIIANGIQSNGSILDLQTIELDIFLGSNYLVTHFSDPAMPAVEFAWQRLTKDERLHQHGADYLCHAVLDHLVDDFMPVLDRMDTEIEWLEDRVLEKPEPGILQHILELKHSVMSMRRIVSPLREIINRLSRDDYPQIDRQSKIYYRDIYDHLVQIQDLTESIRDIVSSSMDIYLNSTSLRLNEVMKALTIVSTIFLPLTFMAGVYGMNFRYMPEINWVWGYPMVWFIFMSIFVGMIWFFKSRKWF